MEGFKRGFYTASKKLERKPESNLGQSSFPQPQPFSQSQQSGEEQKQGLENSTCNNSNLIREVNESDEVCSSLGGFGVQSFQPDEYEITHQSGPKPPGRGLKIEAFERKTNAQAGRKKLNGRVTHRQLERQMDAFYNMQNHQDMNTATLKDLVMKQEQETQLLKESKNGTTEYWIDPNGCRTLSLTSDETSPDQEEMHLLQKPTTPLSKLSEVPIEITGFLISKANRKNQIEQDFLQQEWKHVQEEEDVAKIKT